MQGEFKCLLFQFCLALRFYATGSFYSAIGDTKGVHKSSVSRAVRDVSNFLTSIHQRHVKFPKREEFVGKAEEFARIYGFSCVIGCMDGTHVAIIAILAS